MEMGEREIIYLSLHCHHQNDFCINLAAMVLNVHRNHKAYQRQGEGGGGDVGMEMGEREIIYLSLHCHHQNDFCINLAAMRAILMFHNCEGQSHKTVSTDHNL